MAHSWLRTELNNSLMTCVFTKGSHMAAYAVHQINNVQQDNYKWGKKIKKGRKKHHLKFSLARLPQLFRHGGSHRQKQSPSLPLRTFACSWKCSWAWCAAPTQLISGPERGQPLIFQKYREESNNNNNHLTSGPEEQRGCSSAAPSPAPCCRLCARDKWGLPLKASSPHGFKQSFGWLGSISVKSDSTGQHSQIPPPSL